MIIKAGRFSVEESSFKINLVIMVTKGGFNWGFGQGIDEFNQFGGYREKI